MKKRNLSKVVSLLLVISMFATILSGCTTEPEAPPPEPVYIAAPHVAGEEAPTEYAEPTFYQNEGGPEISVTYLGVIQIGDQYFKDSNNNQTLDTFEDWRLTTDERMDDLLGQMTEDQRIGLLRNSLMASPTVTAAEEVYDDSGNVQLDKLVQVEEVELDPDDPYAAMALGYMVGNITDSDIRSGVIRKDTDAETGALFNNTLNQIAEWVAVSEGETMIPYMIISNPMNTGYPLALGFGAATADGDVSLVSDFASIDVQIWDAKGIHQMYGPQIDLITDPRWSRNHTTYSEDPDQLSDIAVALVEGYQSGADGANIGDVSLIMKHFPGDGAAENGFESHHYIGEWRLYPTEGSLEYHLAPFQAAIDAGLEGIMPGYSRPTTDERSTPQSYMGLDVNVEEIANAYNTTLLTDLLRDTMGFDGYINTDSNIITGQPFGAEDLSETERIALAINAGNDVIGDGFIPVLDLTTTAEAVTSGAITDEAFDRATTNRMVSWLDLGMFDNPYRDPAESKQIEADLADERQANKDAVNHASVVLMKNSNDVLPLNDTSKTVYLASLTNSGENEGNMTQWTTAIEAAGYTIVDDPAAADIAILDVVPKTVGNSDPHIHEIDLVENKELAEYDVDEPGLTGETIEVTTVQDIDEVAEIAATVHANGGVVIASINITSPWILTNLEPHVDALIGSFGTTAQARMDVLTGAYMPTGKLPITMVANEAVIAIDENFNSASPNDIPGYMKDDYISADVLAQSPSGSYAYQDTDGNIYTYGFGLTMTAKEQVDNSGSSNEGTDDSNNEGSDTTSANPAEVALVYDADPTLVEGDWVLTGAYTAADGLLTVKENAVFLSVEHDIEENELVNEADYIHADAIKLAGTMTFDPSISENEYSCSSGWADWTTVNVIGEGNAEFFGANKFRIRDDDEGVFFEEVTGVAADELLDVIGVNAQGQLIVGYSDDSIVTDEEATFMYAYIFSKA